METLYLQGLEKKSFAVLDSKLNEDGFSLGLLTMELLDPEHTAVVAKHKTKPPPVAVYSWYVVHLTKSIGAALNQSSSSVEKSIVAKTDLVCSLKSGAIAEYWALSGQALMLITDSNLDPKAQEPAENPEPSETTPKPVEVAGEAGEQAQEDQEKQGEEEDQEGEEEPEAHHGFGYHKDPYEWTQSTADVSIKVRLPADVTKQDVCCTIGVREVVIGLLDGTTFARGTLFAPVDPDASSWTIGDRV